MKDEHSESIQEFADRFRTEEDCRKYLEKIRWVDGFVCPYCKHTKSWIYKKGIHRCQNCSKDVSVTAKTVFHGRHLPLRTWLFAVWFMVSQKNGISALGLARELGMTRLPTGLELLKNIRKSIEDLTKHGYQHVKVKKQYDISGDDNTPLVHRVASLLKRWMLGTHQGAIHLENLQPYLDEYVFRFNRRTSASRGKLFYRLIQELLKPIEKK